MPHPNIPRQQLASSGRWLRTVKAKGVVLGATSGTESLNLSTAHFISAIYLRVFNTNGSTSNTATSQTIEQVITNITVKGNGNKTLKSYDGEDCRKLAQYRYGDLPPMDETQGGSDVQFALFPILFNRFDGDTEYILPAKLFSTLQLEFDYAFVDSSTVGYTTSATNAKYDLIVEEYVSADNPRFKKILVETEVSNFTSVASGNKDVILPRGNKYRRIMVHAYEAAIEDGVDITDVELRINNGASTPFTDTWDMLQLANAMTYRAKTTKKLIADMKDNSTYDSRVTKQIIAMAGSAVTPAGAATGNNMAVIDVIAGDRDTIALFTGGDADADGAAITSEEAIYISVESPVVSSCILLDFDPLNDGKQLLSTLGLDSLVLRLTQAGAGATVKTITQEVWEGSAI